MNGKTFKQLLFFLFVFVLFLTGCSFNNPSTETMNQDISKVEEEKIMSEVVNTEKGEENHNQKNKELKDIKNENIPSHQKTLEGKTDSPSALEKSISQKDMESEPEIEPNKFVYLTFDDGPSIITGEILDVLNKHNVKATFFVNGITGENDSIYATMINRIVDEGHAIGNHGYTHEYSISYASKDKFKENIDKLDKYLQQVAGVKTRLYRFQGGSSNTVHKRFLKNATIKELFQLMKDSGYEYFDWNVSSGDAGMTTPPASRSVNYVLKGVKGKENSIVLMHDSEKKKHNAEAVDTIIQNLKKEGYGFKKLSTTSYNYQHRK